LILFAVIAGSTACTKSSDFIARQPGGPITDPSNPTSNGPVLTQLIQVDRGDSAVTTMLYDKESRLVGEETQRKAFDMNGTLRTYTQRYTYTRDNIGRITKVVLSSQSAGVEDYTETYDHFYTADGVKTLSHTLRTYELSGSMVTDSTAYIYAGARVSKVELHRIEAGSPAQKLTFDEYSYDGIGNITRVIHSEDYAGTGSFQSFQIKLDYDTKINPQFADDDVFITQLNKYTSPNNLTKITYGPESAIMQYQYRPDGRPSKSVVKATEVETIYVYSY